MRENPIIVTGASGFVGANLCRSFAARGQRVIGLGGPSGGDWRLKAVQAEFPAFETLSLDLRDRAATRSLLEAHSPEVVINCAAYGAYSCQTEADLIYAINFEGVRTLLDCLRDGTTRASLKAFIQFGSSSEYGANCTAPSESAALIPDSHYSVSKIAATSLVQYYGKSLGMPAWAFRLYSVYGPMEESSRLIPRILLAASRKEIPPLVDPRVSRDFIHVDDVFAAVASIIDAARAKTLKQGEVYNIGSGVKTTLADLVSLVRSCFGVTREPAWGSMPDRAWDHPDWFANPEKAGSDLGWRARVSLSEGLESMMGWLRANPALVEQSLENSVMGTGAGR